MAAYVDIGFHGTGCTRIAAATIVVGDWSHFPVPVHPKHDFVGVIVVPDIERRVIRPRTRTIYAKRRGDVGHAADRIVNIVVNIRVGFDTAGVGMIGGYPPVPFVIGPYTLRPGATAPNVVVNGISIHIPGGPLVARLKFLSLREICK